MTTLKTKRAQPAKADTALKMLIAGRWVAAENGRTRPVLNPATGETLAEAPEASAGDVAIAAAAARAAFADRRWAGKSAAERSLILWRWADLVEKNLSALAELERDNCGKPDKQVRDGDIPFAVDNIRYFASILRALAGRGSAEFATGYTSYLRREPVGVVALVAPWNYPLMMAVWKILPAVAAGNSVVFKPSELTPLSALELGRLAIEAGLPDGVLNIVTGGEEAGVALTSHPQVDMISFTGDTETGKKIMAQAAPSLKRLHLELGGKAPFLVFGDADLEAAVAGAAVGGIINAGQDCTAATRLYVEKPRFEEFRDRLVALLKTVKIGDPKSRDTDLGPLICAEQRSRVEGFVARALAAGAKTLAGGGRPHGRETKNGWFYEPTLIVGARQDAEIVQNEVFGPVLCLLPFDGEQEGLSLANDCRFGLAASVWTKDAQRSLRVSAALRFGTVWINDHLPLTSEMPHGGFKHSGFGKDLSESALEEYTVAKHVMADMSGLARKGWHYTALGQP